MKEENNAAKQPAKTIFKITVSIFTNPFMKLFKAKLFQTMTFSSGGFIKAFILTCFGTNI